jgi:hypothetical protein
VKVNVKILLHTASPPILRLMRVTIDGLKGGESKRQNIVACRLSTHPTPHARND